MFKIQRLLARSLVVAALLYGLSILVSHLLRDLVDRGDASGSQGAFTCLPALGSYTTLVVASIALASSWGGSRWHKIGFQKPDGPWLRYVLYALVVGSATTLGLKLTPGTGMGAGLKGSNPLVVLLVVLYGSFAEELFTRGWFQGFLDPLRECRVRIDWATVSVPVLASGFVFSAMHLTLLGKGVDGWTVGFILAFTAIVGILAAEVRERSASLLPAVITHLAGNAGGLVGGLVYVAIYAARHGQTPEL